MTLSDEIERLDGPSREMDARIVRAIGFGRVEQEWHYEELEWYAWKNKERSGPWEVLKPYTASLDAAMMLMPDGWNWIVQSERPLYGFKPSAQCWPDRLDRRTRVAEAATPALALAAAAIRARTEEKGHG